MLRPVALGALLALAMGCPSDPADPAIVVGTGELEFVELAAGDELEIVFGPQGGYHVNAGLRARGLEVGDRNDLGSARNPEIVFDLLFEGTSLVLSGTLTQGLDPAPASARPWEAQLLGRRVILDMTDDAPYDGVDAELSVTVTDADGVVLSDARAVVLVPNPFN